MRYKRFGIGLIFIWFFIGGITHLFRPQFFMPAMPPILPYPMGIILISGVFELLGAVGVLCADWRIWAGRGLFLLTICVTPVNIYMWQHPDLFTHIPAALLGWRLVLQVLLLMCIWWSTQERALKKGHSH